MAVKIVNKPYVVFQDIDGSPLDMGSVHIGAEGLNPLSNPRQAYWDEALTIPANNIRTMAGYISQNGSPGNLFVNEAYSILVKNRLGEIVYSNIHPYIPEDAEAPMPDHTLKVSQVSANYAFTDTDEIDILEVTTSGNPITITLPTYSDNLGRSITIRMVDAGGSVIIDGEGSDTIDGDDEYILDTEFTSATVYGSASEWGLLVSASDAAGSGAEIGDFRYTLIEEEKNGWKNVKYQALSQTLYAELFLLTGHGSSKNSTDALAAEADGTFHIPDGQFLFTRAGQSWPLVDTSIDITTDQITLTAHGLAIDGTQNGRPIKLMRVPGQSPTLPTGADYTEYDQNYLRVIDADTIELYASESEAIAIASTTGRVNWSDAGSGTFKLTTNGCYQDSQANSIDKLKEESGGVAPVEGEVTIPDDGSDSSKLKLLSGGSTRNIFANKKGVETRPAYLSLNMQIKVIGSSVSTGEAYDNEMWDSTWKSCVTWTAGNSITLTHDLNVAFNGYMGQIFVRDPAVPDKIWNANYTIYESNQYGQILNGIDGDLNNCYLQMSQQATPSGRYFNDAGSSAPVPITWEYQVILYKPSLFAVTKTSSIVSVTTDATVSIETVEKTIVIPSSVTADLSITITAGPGIDRTHKINIVNESDYKATILYSAQEFWVMKQRTTFYITDSTLIWASAGREIIYDVPSNTGNVLNTDANLIREYTAGEYWLINKSATGVERSAPLNIDDIANTSYGPSAQAAVTPQYTASATPYMNTNNSTYPIKKIYYVHEPA